jgi:DNA-binding response OmpR family regulator
VDLGADAFLKKPFEVDELRALIRGLLGSDEEVSR